MWPRRAGSRHRCWHRTKQYAPQQQGEDYAPAQVAPGYDNGQGNYADTDLTDEQANEAPPPLPEYDQPPAPDPDYIWTPGYWGVGAGRVLLGPRMLVAAPYADALWTPGYTGDTTAEGIASTMATGGCTSGSMAASITGLATSAAAMKAATGTANHFYYNTAITHVNTSVRNVYVHNVTVNNRAG